MRSLLIVFFCLLVSCSSHELKTFITEKPIKMDSSDLRRIKQEFHYEYIDTPSQILGGLKPKLPIAEVQNTRPDNNCVWFTKGMMMTCRSLVVKINNKLMPIDTEEKFRNLFAPIKDEQEAISYVSYQTQSYPEYDIPWRFWYRFYTSQFPSTYSKRVDGGFEVLLHDKKVFGCGPHPYFYKVYRISFSGDITLLKTVKMFEDPAEDTMCVD